MLFMYTQTLQAISIHLDYSTKFDVRTCLMRTSHSKVIGHGEIKLGMTWKFYSYLLASMDGETWCIFDKNTLYACKIVSNNKNIPTWLNIVKKISIKF